MMLMATIHIVGTFILMFAFECLLLVAGAWEANRYTKALMKELSVREGMDLETMPFEKSKDILLKYNAEMFSSELLRNRLSDLCGYVRIGWDWLSTFSRYGLLVFIAYLTLTDGPENAVYAWWSVAIMLVMWIVSYVFASVVHLLTGRFPGQARAARRDAQKVISGDFPN